MVSRRESRERRKAEKLAKFNEAKVLLIDRLSDRTPRVPIEISNDRLPRFDSNATLPDSKAPRISATSEGSRFRSLVTWCDSRHDDEGSWSWGEPRAWTDEELASIILPMMTHFSRLTWGEVDHAGSESGHKMHHGHDTSDLVTEAQQRWIEIGLEEFDYVFRFRLGGKKRLWGFIVQAHFHLVWWDREHKIYPV